jgi:sulfatase maturation enzyme AslB (radical SAM superfamily)
MSTAPVGAVPVRLRTRGTADAYETACAAPAIQLRFDPNGLVTTCCKTLQPLGHIGSARLPEIWEGAVRNQVVRALEVDDFSIGCQRCGSEIRQEGRAVSYAAIHDEWAGHLTADPASRAWPVRMEMNLSNACNLQCVQCDGESSSAIRLHREKRPPLPTFYGDEFFDDLVPFLPHLERIVFAGGEPFLGAENFRIWDLIAEHAPHIDCMVVTNATQLTPRIEALLERVRFSFVFSLDGITPETYEAIRIGAHLDRVLANIDRFCEYARVHGTTASVNHCLMPQNVHEFPELLEWAEDKGLFVNVSVVRHPAHSSIAALAPERIQAIDRELAAADARVRARLALNLPTWEAERSRIASWAAGSSMASGSEVQTVMWFRCAGSGPYDHVAARHELEAYASDGVVHEISVGPDDRITSVQADFLPEPHELVGQLVRDLTNAVTDAFGEMQHYEVRSTSDDRVDAHAVFGDRPARITTVAMRDATGWASEARLLLAFGAAGDRRTTPA